MAIFFNTRGEQHREFRHTSEHGFVLEGLHWKSVAHYVEAQRFDCDEARDLVRESTYAFAAKTLARERPNALRPNWLQMRDGAMEKAQRAKFASHPVLAEKLTSTGNAEIIEASPMSKHWGAGSDGTGKNMLGRILMKIRADLRASLEAASAGTENRLG
jgi:ribA/ribD-fused uncharacterized protein